LEEFTLSHLVVVCLLAIPILRSVFVSEKNTAPTPVSIDPLRIVEGVEPLLTVKEAAALLRWSPDSARRYFKDLPGVLVKYQPKRHKRAYRHYMIPKSVLQREWQAMAGANSLHRSAA
jgi:hypothetical protein